MGNKYKTIDEIPVFIQSHNLVLKIYKITSDFPKSELFGLTAQIRRASVSIPANISEGYHRHTTKELIQYLYNARGSCGEVIYYLKLSMDLRYISYNDKERLILHCDEINKQLNGWIKSLRLRLK